MTRRWLEEERGSSTLEFLLILIPIFLFVVGAVDVGGIAGARETMLRASHAAVEEMQKSGQYDAVAQQALQNTLAGTGINPANVTVSTSPPAATNGPVWVTLTTDYQVPVTFPGAQAQYQISGGAAGTAFP